MANLTREQKIEIVEKYKQDARDAHLSSDGLTWVLGIYDKMLDEISRDPDAGLTYLSVSNFGYDIFNILPRRGL